MWKLPNITAFSLLVLTAPALGDESTPERTPWKVADPTSEKVVRWVVEDCAAYPVTEDAAPERSIADIHPQTATAPAARQKRPRSSN